MHQFTFFAAALLGAALSAQGPGASGALPGKAPLPPAVLLDGKAPLSVKSVAAPSERAAAAVITPQIRRVLDAAERDADVVVIDQPRPEGPVFCRGRNYKAKFDAGGEWAFVAQPPVGVRSTPIGFRLQSCSVGQVHLAVAAEPRRALGDERIVYRYRGVTEIVDLRPDGVEQSFCFESLPGRGELVLRVGVTGDRELRDVGDGLLLAGPAGDVTYSEAVAFDAAGRRVAAPTMVDGDTIVIRVPRAFVESAALPLVVDPVVANATVVAGNVPYSNADITWDEASEVFSVVYERFFSINDIDVHLRRVDDDMNPVGGLTTIDVTLDVWRLPKIANCRFYARNLVVAEVSVDASPPAWIGGRITSGDGVPTTSQFDIAKAGVSGHGIGDKLNPDVGGDPSGAPPTYFTVVWERVYSATDHDIHMKQVDWNGQLRSASPTLIDNSSHDERRPSISNSNGPPPAGDQRHVVCYERTTGQNNPDVHVALLTWDGQLPGLVGGNPFLLSSNPDSLIRPVATTPTDGSLDGLRYSLIAFEQVSFQNGDIMGMVITTDGTIVRTQVDLTAIELGNNPAVLRPQRRPRVDSDGVRFTLVYDEEAGAGAFDVRAAMFGWNPGSTGLFVHDAEPIGAGVSGPDFAPAIASVYGTSGTGTREVRYGIAYESGVGTESIGAVTYEALAPGGRVYRSLGCGIASINLYDGPPVIGNTVEFEIAQQGLVGFLFGFPQAGLPIPGCSGCQVGVNGSTVLVNPLPLTIPPDVRFVGVRLSVQGFRFPGGSCYGSIALSDVIDVTVQ